jgi:dephospho-CoA kinase
MMAKFVVGLTGGIGSGKTTVAQVFAEQGVSVIDADKIARDLVSPHQPALMAITEHFGSGSLLQDGTLDRTQLRKIIFADEDNRLWLEKLLHPLIRQEIETQVAASQSAYCLVVIPLLFETGAYPFIDRIAVVDIAEEEQRKRVTERDNLSHHEIDAILKTQLSRHQRLAKKADIIDNTGSRADLNAQVQQLHQLYLQLSLTKK